MILNQVDLLEQNRGEAFVLLAITAGLFLAALILIAILILRRKNKQDQDVYMEAPRETSKTDPKKRLEKSEDVKRKKEAQPKEKASGPVGLAVDEATKKKEVPEDFMPASTKTVSQESKPSGPSKEFKQAPLKEADAKSEEKSAGSSNLKHTEGHTKTNGQVKEKESVVPVPQAPSVEKQPKTSVPNEKATTTLSKDQVAKSVAEAIDRGSSKEDNMARIKAYLEELKSKGASKAASEPSKGKEETQREKKKENNTKEHPVEESKGKEEPHVAPDPEMPSGALNPPFVPNPKLPETPTAESIRLEFERPGEPSITLGEKDSTEPPAHATGSSSRRTAEQEQAEQVSSPSVAKKESKSTPSKEEGSPAPLVAAQETNMEKAQKQEPPVRKSASPISKQQAPASSPEQKGTPAAKAEEKGVKKDSKNKKIPVEGYRSFADWLRQTKG